MEARRVICPNCGEMVSAEYVNIQRMVAICPDCDTVFSIEFLADPSEKSQKSLEIDGVLQNGILPTLQPLNPQSHKDTEEKFGDVSVIHYQPAGIKVKYPTSIRKSDERIILEIGGVLALIFLLLLILSNILSIHWIVMLALLTGVMASFLSQESVNVLTLGTSWLQFYQNGGSLFTHSDYQEFHTEDVARIHVIPAAQNGLTTAYVTEMALVVELFDGSHHVLDDQLSRKNALLIIEHVNTELSEIRENDHINQTADAYTDEADDILVGDDGEFFEPDHTVDRNAPVIFDDLEEYFEPEDGASPGSSPRRAHREEEE